MELHPRVEGRFEGGRRLTSSGRLAGALHTLGYYSTDVCLGSPPRCFDLIIDTGSSVMAVPCSSCRQCGAHRCGAAGRFNPSESASARPVSCRASPPGFECESCAPGDVCAYSTEYTEGSSIRGHVLTDVAHFTRQPLGAGLGSAAARNLSTRVYFGCQTSEAGMFRRQQADGIIGMQPHRARARAPPMLLSLSRSHGAAAAFSLCLSDRAGLFLLGGEPAPAELRARGALIVPMAPGARARYTLQVRDVSVSGAAASNTIFQSIGLPSSVYAPTYVDSGTTFVYASTPLYRALHAHIQRHAPALRRLGNKVCAHMSDAGLDAMPSLRIHFESSPAAPLLVRPRQYMVEFPESSGASSAPLGAHPPTAAPTRHFCVAIFDNQQDGTVIGASIMRQREVIFELARSTISFVDADCDAISPATSGELERALVLRREEHHHGQLLRGQRVIGAPSGRHRGATTHGQRARLIGEDEWRLVLADVHRVRLDAM